MPVLDACTGQTTPTTTTPTTTTPTTTTPTTTEYGEILGKYYIDLGELNSTCTGYSLSFNIPVGYTVWDVFTSGPTKIVCLKTPAIEHILAPTGEWETSDWREVIEATVDCAPCPPEELAPGSYLTLEEELTSGLLQGYSLEDIRDFEAATYEAMGCTTTVGHRKVNSYDDYYFFMETTDHGYEFSGWISLGKAKTIIYYDAGHGPPLVKSPTSRHYETISISGQPQPVREALKQAVDEVFSSIQIGGVSPAEE